MNQEHEWRYDRRRYVVTAVLKQLQINPKKFGGFNGSRTHGFCVRAKELYLLSYEDPYIRSKPICWVYLNPWWLRWCAHHHIIFIFANPDRNIITWKGFVQYLRTRCFVSDSLTRSLLWLVRFLIRQQLVRKYRTPALSMYTVSKESTL